MNGWAQVGAQEGRKDYKNFALADDEKNTNKKATFVDTVSIQSVSFSFKAYRQSRATLQYS